MRPGLPCDNSLKRKTRKKKWEKGQEEQKKHKLYPKSWKNPANLRKQRGSLQLKTGLNRKPTKFGRNVLSTGNHRRNLQVWKTKRRTTNKTKFPWHERQEGTAKGKEGVNSAWTKLNVNQKGENYRGLLRRQETVKKKRTKKCLRKKTGNKKSLEKAWKREGGKLLAMGRFSILKAFNKGKQYQWRRSVESQVSRTNPAGRRNLCSACERRQATP